MKASSNKYIDIFNATNLIYEELRQNCKKNYKNNFFKFFGQNF